MYSELVAWFDGPMHNCPECAGWDEWVEVEDLKGGLDLAANQKRRYSLDFVNHRPDKERRGSKVWWPEGTDMDREAVATMRYLRFVPMPDGKRYDGRYRLPGDLDWARENGVDIDDPEAMAKWYSVSLEEYLEGQEWADENFPLD
jgi:predicted DCC family thiol-disulfide oxidoreductase YuxK